jgi:hypothetical protein
LRQPSFPGIMKPIYPVHLPLEEVTVLAGHEVFMVVDLYFTNSW